MNAILRNDRGDVIDISEHLSRHVIVYNSTDCLQL